MVNSSKVLKLFVVDDLSASTVVSTVVMQKNTTVSEVSTAVKTGTKSVAGVGAVSRLQQVSVDRMVDQQVGIVDAQQCNGSRRWKCDGSLDGSQRRGHLRTAVEENVLEMMADHVGRVMEDHTHHNSPPWSPNLAAIVNQVLKLIFLAGEVTSTTHHNSPPWSPNLAAIVNQVLKLIFFAGEVTSTVSWVCDELPSCASQ
ncbi:hypothetical protein CAPTEDRAFT_211117 [Capitella teleta]|uniref:Uncharacterized protein n=1 Tax=Capitella teleta TaxID=283909 RepID=R7TNN6_CAPTE|nr:hypothetical protein CAPTEDRAFT_211117 [Capitella teleta]|eukprot:ELT95249.1 hypothetical protein CAPTEDRAFT_211117 [Capitella teleta]